MMKFGFFLVKYTYIHHYCIMNIRRKDRRDFSEADLDQLRKLFIMPDSADKFLEFGQDLLDLIHSFFQDKGGIHSAVSLVELGKMFGDIKLPQDPQLLEDVLREIKKKVVNHSVKVGNPYYIGHMTSAVPYYMIFLEMLIAALNQNQVKIESAKASTYVEREVIAWVHRMVYNKNKSFYKTNIQNRNVSLGNVTTDGTMANMAALLVARNKAFPADGNFTGVRNEGLAQALWYYDYDRAVVIISERGHYSITKVARIMGIGERNVLRVRVDADNRMDICELKKICSNLESEGSRGGMKTKILAIIGIAGTTETGNIDRLKEIAKVAKKYHAHFHVDAAWGGGLLAVESFRYLFDGIALADSVTVDAHKLLYNPVSMGMVIFNNEKDSDYLRHSSDYIIRQDSVDLGRFTVEGSRSFASLKLWATFKIMGARGFQLLFDHAFEITASMRGFVEKHRNFEAMNTPELFIFNYRYVPERWQQKLIPIIIDAKDEAKNGLEAGKNSATERLQKVNDVLNAFNRELHKAIREEDDSFVSRTTYRSPGYFYQRTVILRAVLINPLTTPEILKEIIDCQDRLGRKIYKTQFYHALDRI